MSISKLAVTMGARCLPINYRVELSWLRRCAYPACCRSASAHNALGLLTKPLNAQAQGIPFLQQRGDRVRGNRAAHQVALNMVERRWAMTRVVRFFIT